MARILPNLDYRIENFRETEGLNKLFCLHFLQNFLHAMINKRGLTTLTHDIIYYVDRRKVI